VTEPIQNRRNLALYLEFTQVGFAMVVPIGLGYVLDRWIGCLPWFTVAGVVVGLVGGLVQLFRLVSRLDRNEPPNSRDAT
jgi:F0F1-type ATP synthase assembly protein I